MVIKIQKKITRTVDKSSDFVKAHLPQFIIIFTLIGIVQVLKRFPYLNLIPSFEFLGYGFVLFVTTVLFRSLITNKVLILIVNILFLIAAFSVILGGSAVAEFIGFINFVLILFAALRALIVEREFLDIKNKRK